MIGSNRKGDTPRSSRKSKRPDPTGSRNTGSRRHRSYHREDDSNDDDADDDHDDDDDGGRESPTTDYRAMPCNSTRSSDAEEAAPPLPRIPATTATHNYRGFSTSIGDMFANHHQERVDCCAMTCCGIFQSDRDRYLLRGVTPPSPWKRVWVHFFLPLAMFLMAGYVALHIPDPALNELLCLMFLLILLGGILTQCQKGRVKRMEIRKDVLWFKYQLLNRHNTDLSLDQILDQPRPDTDDDETYYYRGQTARDIGCSHPYCFLLGCYSTDKPGPAVLLSSDNADDNVNQAEPSLCSCIYRFFCRPCCGMVSFKIVYIR
jgi:hypothetical protein